MEENYGILLISRDNWKALAMVFILLLAAVLIFVSMRCVYHKGYHDAVHDINESGYVVTHVTNVNTNYFVIEKNINKARTENGK